MKKKNIFLSAMIIALSINVNAQTWGGFLGPYTTTTTTGNCTIGSTLFVKGALIDMSKTVDNSWRSLQANSNLEGLSFFSKTANTNGSAIELYGPTNTSTSDAGSIHYTSYGKSDYGHIFQHYTPASGTLFTNAAISDAGMIVGHGTSLSDIISGDNLTVKDQMGFYSTSDLTARSIHGNTNGGLLSIYSHTGNTNGSGIEMYGDTYTATAGRKGSIHYYSYGSTGDGQVFENYTTSGSGIGLHTNLLIENDGRTMVGHDVSISNAQPGDILTVRSQLGFYKPDQAATIQGNLETGVMSILANNSGADGPTISLHGRSYPPLPSGENRKGMIWYNSYGDNGYGHMFLNYQPTAATWTVDMGIMNDGKVVIGQDLIWASPTTNPTPTGYLLYVAKGILTEKLKVANHSDGANWSDFVFNKDYKLMSLSDVEGYVNTNKHLPEIPSASEVAKDGIDVASMDAKLLQKIEELTLYVIQQQKEIDELKKEIKH